MQDDRLIHNLELRLMRLERQNRLMKRLALLGIAVAAIAGWQGKQQQEFIDAKYIRAEQIEIVSGPDTGLWIQSLLEGGKKAYPQIIIKGRESDSIVIDPRQMFLTKGKDNDTLNTVIEGGRFSAYNNLGGGPSAELMIGKDKAGLEVRTSSKKKMRTEEHESSMFYGALNDEAGLFLQVPTKPVKKVIKHPFAPPGD